MELQDKLLKIFRETNALLSGHFALTSGFHSDSYFQCALVLQDPKYARLLGELIGERFLNEEIDAVIAPAIGGIVIACAIGDYLDQKNKKGLRVIFTERVDDKMALRRGFSIKKGEKVLVVEDVITTGGSIKEVIELAKNGGAKIVGVGSIVDRSGGKVDFGVRKEVLVTLDVKKFTQAECPLCKKGIPVDKPGSRKK
ncbi:MAG: orotate phosphoribosyltransferase [bacterium]|nr:orotate phosphoribosyltransferase [bacterium]